MKAPPKRKGNLSKRGRVPICNIDASMKTLPKRKGSAFQIPTEPRRVRTSMKVPTKLWGNTAVLALMRHDQVASMKAPPKRKGNTTARVGSDEKPFRKGREIRSRRTRRHNLRPASMKALPKRKGNKKSRKPTAPPRSGLNKSPSK